MSEELQAQDASKTIEPKDNDTSKESTPTDTKASEKNTNEESQKVSETTDKDQKEDTSKDKKDSPKKEISHEDNVISSDDFKKINTKFEKKKTIFDKLLHKDTNTEATDKPEKEEKETTPYSEIKKRLDGLSIKIDKGEGKLEAEVGIREAVNERLSSLAEEIGELRSMILDRERSFNEIQTGFERIEDNTHNIQPDKINSKFEKMEKLITENTIKAEKTEMFLNSTKEEIKKYRLIMNNIKSFDNIVDMKDKIKEQIENINDSKNTIDRKGAKIEIIFSELNERLKDFNKQRATVEKLDELTNELLKSVDKIEIKVEEAVLKEDIDKKITPLETQIKELTAKTDTLSQDTTEKLSKIESLDLEDIEKLKKEVAGIEHIISSHNEKILKTQKDLISNIKNIENLKTEREQINKLISENTINNKKNIELLNTIKIKTNAINDMNTKRIHLLDKSIAEGKKIDERVKTNKENIKLIKTDIHNTTLKKETINKIISEDTKSNKENIQLLKNVEAKIKSMHEITTKQIKALETTVSKNDIQIKHLYENNKDEVKMIAKNTLNNNREQEQIKNIINNNNNNNNLEKKVIQTKPQETIIPKVNQIETTKNINEKNKISLAENIDENQKIIDEMLMKKPIKNTETKVKEIQTPTIKKITEEPIKQKINKIDVVKEEEDNTDKILKKVEKQPIEISRPKPIPEVKTKHQHDPIDQRINNIIDRLKLDEKIIKGETKESVKVETNGIIETKKINILSN